MKQTTHVFMFEVRQGCGYKIRSAIFSPAAIGHLMSTVEHSHQNLFVINAREQDDNRCIGAYQVQIVFGEIEVGRLN